MRIRTVMTLPPGTSVVDTEDRQVTRTPFRAIV